jgi:hypothetical protein
MSVLPFRAEIVSVRHIYVCTILIFLFALYIHSSKTSDIRIIHTFGNKHKAVINKNENVYNA